MQKPNLLIILILCLPIPVFAGQPDFALPDLDGKIHRLSDYRGKWVVVNYWATWCPPCLEEIPELEDFYSEHHKRDAIVVGINYEDSDPAYLKSFVAPARQPDATASVRTFVWFADVLHRFT